MDFLLRLTCDTSKQPNPRAPIPSRSLPYRKVIGTLAGTLGPVLVLRIGRTPGASVVATNGVFHFDYICPIYQAIPVSADFQKECSMVDPYPKSPRICVQYGYSASWRSIHCMHR